MLMISFLLIQCSNNSSSKKEYDNYQKDKSSEISKDEQVSSGARQLELQKKKEESFLSEISAIYQESVLGRKITLDLIGSDKKYGESSGGYRLTVKKINLEKLTVCFNAWYGEDENPHQMCIRKVDLGFGEYFLIVDDENFTAPWELYYIRDLD